MPAIPGAFSFHAPPIPDPSHTLPAMTSDIIAQTLIQLGCPADKAPEMAAQLDKRAAQLVTERGWAREQALLHLLSLMRQGWAAKERGL